MHTLLTTLTSTVRLLLDLLTPTASAEDREAIQAQRESLEKAFLAWNGLDAEDAL